MNKRIDYSRFQICKLHPPFHQFCIRQHKQPRSRCRSLIRQTVKFKKFKFLQNLKIIRKEEEFIQLPQKPRRKPRLRKWPRKLRNFCAFCMYILCFSRTIYFTRLLFIYPIWYGTHTKIRLVLILGVMMFTTRFYGVILADKLIF